MFSAFTGALFLFAIMSTIATAGGDGSVWALLALYAAVLLAWIWLSTLSYYMRNQLVA
jgi:hypothetical protein